MKIAEKLELADQGWDPHPGFIVGLIIATPFYRWYIRRHTA